MRYATRIPGKDNLAIRIFFPTSELPLIAVSR
jgi:hypothetical protein